MVEGSERRGDGVGPQDWGESYAQLSAADRETPLDLENLERLAVAAYLTGRIDESADVWARAHHECLRLGDVPRAARCAFWLAFGLLNKGDVARAAGWVARARRLLAELEHDCVEQGYLLWPVAFECIVRGDAATAHDTFARAAKIGDRFHDIDLATLARHGEGRALIHLGDVPRGLALLDEVMVAVTAGDVSPVVVGDVYCSVIEACQEVFDLRRAQEWTTALTHWSDSQPNLVLYRGQCLLHRAEIMQLHGAWPDAIEEAKRALERLSHPPGQPAVGAAFYQHAELHRLLGRFAEAEEAYREASRWGREPQPGLALLRLTQGHVDAAEAMIGRVVDEVQDRSGRAKVLAAYVEIMLAANDVPSARVAADELSSIARDMDVPFLLALSAHATGAVLLAEADAGGALGALRRAWTAWHALKAPYEAARARVLIGLACRALGDDDGAAMELDSARWVFEQLRATPDRIRVEYLARRADPPNHGLTTRELQVLRLVAAGATNKAIAAELVLSERTVDRHVSNIFTKFGVSSRAAATAYAYEHHLVSW